MSNHGSSLTVADESDWLLTKFLSSDSLIFGYKYRHKSWTRFKQLIWSSNMNLKFIFNFLIIVASKSISTKKFHSIRQPKSRFFELSRSGRDLLHWNRMGNRFSRRSEIKRLQGAAQHRYLAKVCDHLRAVSQDQDNISDFCRSF